MGLGGCCGNKFEYIDIDIVIKDMNMSEGKRKCHPDLLAPE